MDLENMIAHLLQLPVGIPSSFEPLPNPLTTTPWAKTGKQLNDFVVGIMNSGKCKQKLSKQ